MVICWLQWRVETDVAAAQQTANGEEKWGTVLG